jgi:hypothetical protein
MRLFYFITAGLNRLGGLLSRRVKRPARKPTSYASLYQAARSEERTAAEWASFGSRHWRSETSAHRP